MLEEIRRKRVAHVKTRHRKDMNNAVLLNLLRTLPEGGLETRAMEGPPSIAELFTHIHNAERLMGEDVNAMVCVGGGLCRLDLWIGEAVSA